MADKLMVVAHPDDEIVFGGAHLIQAKNWMVVCITNAENMVRRLEFETVMHRLQVEHEIWNYRDTYSYHFNKVRLKRDLQRLIIQRRFKKVVSHGLRGEYGHPQHKAIAQILNRIVPCNLYAFSIGLKTLPSPILREKRELLQLYASQRTTINELCRDDGLDLYINKEHFIRVK